MLSQLSRELNRRPDSDISLLCAFYKVPVSYNRKAIVQSIVDAMSPTDVVSGYMPEDDEVLVNAWEETCKNTVYVETMRNYSDGSTQCGPTAWKSGKRIGDRSGFGIVRIACCDSDCKYVMKIQPLQDKIQHEIKMQQMLAENGIAPPIIDSWICQGNMVIVMPMLKHTLKYVLATAVDKQVFIGALDAYVDLLRRVHALGYWHGDAKSDNCMVDENGRFYLIDMGLTRPITTRNSDINYIYNIVCEYSYGEYGILAGMRILKQNLADLLKPMGKKMSDIDKIKLRKSLESTFIKSAGVHWTTGNTEIDKSIALTEVQTTELAIKEAKRRWITEWSKEIPELETYKGTGPSPPPFLLSLETKQAIAHGSGAFQKELLEIT